MATPVPVNQVDDSQKLDADGLVSLFTIYPVVGGQMDVKSGPEATYQGVLYESLPIKLSGEKMSADGSSPTPRLIVGQPDLDLLPIKGLVHAGNLEGARIERRQVLLEDLLDDFDSVRVSYYKVKRVEGYTRTQLTLLLSTFSGAAYQPFPHRQYLPPEFPWVVL